MQTNGGSYNNHYYKVTVSCKLAGRPEKATVRINFANEDNVKSTIFRKHINVPENSWYVERNDKPGFAYSRLSNGKQVIFLWEDASVEHIDMQGNEYPSYYDSDVTKAKITESIRKYGGFYFYADTNIIKKQDFYSIWQDSKNIETGRNGFKSSMFFSSVMYDWQLRLILRSSSMTGMTTTGLYMVLANVQGDKVETSKIDNTYIPNRHKTNNELIEMVGNERYYNPVIELQSVSSSLSYGNARYKKVLYIK